MHWRTVEFVLKGAFLALTCLYAFVTYSDTQDPSPSNPSFSEWDVCWPVATWYISWHVVICLSVVSLPSRLFAVGLDGLAGHDIPQGPDWRRLTILFLWYISGVPVAYMMQAPCGVGAPGIWARAFRVFIEGVVAFGLGGLIYGLGRCLFPSYPSRRPRVVLPYLPEKMPSAPLDGIKSSGAADSV